MVATTLLAMTACAPPDRGTAADEDSRELALDSPDPNSCTAVTMTAPGNGFFGSVGTPITLTAVATCPLGQTPEYQFLVKPVGAANWQFLAEFVPGSSSWSPLSPGPWTISAVVRTVGVLGRYQARSMGVVGTVTAVADQAPVAIDDAITTNVNTPGSTDLLGNDSDPDGDALSVASVTPGTHGTVKVTAGIATYTPAMSYVGADSFTYTLSDGHGMTATGNVLVMVNSGPACTISVAQPSPGTLDQSVELTATASCNAGPAEVQWYHKVNSAYVVVQPFSTMATLDFSPTFIGTNLFYASVRTVGTVPAEGNSNIVSIDVADDVPICTAVRMTSPTKDQHLTAGAVQALTATATCPEDTVPEFQFWVKVASAVNWQILPGYTTDSGSWTPPSAGAWNISAVARSVGSHGSYQVRSMSVAVTVDAPVSVGFSDAFTRGTTGSQCTDWTAFLAGLTGSSYHSVTISGTFDLTGVTCNNPAAATQICQAMHNGDTTSVFCNGRTWETGSCGGVELAAITEGGPFCGCSSPGYMVRPCIGHGVWGGVNTSTCNAPSQTITVTCQ